jgi:hypothetical protein
MIVSYTNARTKVITMAEVRESLLRRLPNGWRRHIAELSDAEDKPGTSGEVGISFERILNWPLLRGSHEFPGPDGGTSVNEAAVVVAGLQYRAVADIRDLPECFCPVIGAYTLVLNEMMPDSPRQRLLPYATSLAGTADEFAVKIRRGEYLALAAARMFTARALRWTD